MADEKEMAKRAEEELEAKKPAGGLGVSLKSVHLEQPAVGAKFIAEHTVGPDETLSHIALKYYGNAGREFWSAIYEANKAVIGDNPGSIRPGIVLNIPEIK
jgi:nucleoid-associated protein YgaU